MEPKITWCVACGADNNYKQGCCRSCYISFHRANNPHLLTESERKSK